MRLIDTHTHLFSDKFDGDRSDVVGRAIDAGVERMYLPNISKDTTEAMNALVAEFPQHCFPMIGLHPCHVDADSYQAEVDHVASELQSGRYAAVGETGLDYHWDLTFKAQQHDALRQQITLAKTYRLPIVLHTRESFDDTYQLIAEQNDDCLTGVFHCFSGSAEDAMKVAELGGFYIGIGGVATFKKTTHIDVLPQVPLDLIVLETDSPYLAPTPYRGKRNESAYLVQVANRVAEIMDIPADELAERTTANALQLYQG
jgi:TatD DNase family protein